MVLLFTSSIHSIFINVLRFCKANNNRYNGSNHPASHYSLELLKLVKGKKPVGDQSNADSHQYGTTYSRDYDG